MLRFLTNSEHSVVIDTIFLHVFIVFISVLICGISGITRQGGPG